MRLFAHRNSERFKIENLMTSVEKESDEERVLERTIRASVEHYLKSGEVERIGMGVYTVSNKFRKELETTFNLMILYRDGEGYGEE